MNETTGTEIPDATLDETPDGPGPADGAGGADLTPDRLDVLAGVTVELDDAALATARAAAVDESGDADEVGDPVDVYAEDAVAVTVRFQSLVDGYRGWQWSVTLALLDAGHPTVSEVVLLPGPDALLAPAWVPWEQRVRSGDLRVGDLLPPAPDDPRLVPAYLQSDDPAVEEVAHELGIGRVRVLSREGRVDAAERWHDGPFGPGDEMALHAPGHCATCGFYLQLAGSLGVGFGACGNEFSPADGHVVDAGYGCGAHSEAIGTGPARSAAADTVLDELRLEVHRHPGQDAGGDPALDAPVEDLVDHGVVIDDGPAVGDEAAEDGDVVAEAADPDPAADPDTAGPDSTAGPDPAAGPDFAADRTPPPGAPAEG